MSLRALPFELPSSVDAAARFRGPGFLESCGWTVAYLVAQGLAAAACVCVLLLSAYEGWPDDLRAAVNLLLELNLESSFLLTGVTTLGALAIIVPAVRLRLGRDMRSRLQLRRPESRGLLLATGALVPLAVLAHAFYEFAHMHWVSLVERFPALAPIAQADTLQALAAQSAGEPFGILVVALALGPALGEEIVFRGLIGTGLVRRWGRLLGVAATTILFAGVHGFPPHAVATIPLGLFLHYCFLRTGSLWTPIVLHFLNNALAVAFLKYPLLGELPGSPVVLIAAALYVTIVVVLLARPSDGGASRKSSPSTLRRRWHLGWTEALAGSGILGFTTAFVWSVLERG